MQFFDFSWTQRNVAQDDQKNPYLSLKTAKRRENSTPVTLTEDDRSDELPPSPPRK